MKNKESFESIIADIQSQIDKLSRIEIRRDDDYEIIVEINKEVDKIHEYVITRFAEIINREKEFTEKQMSIAYKTYDSYEKQSNAVRNYLNSNFINSGIKLKKDVEENIKESKRILPQVISFSSLFVAVIGLIVANISTMNKNEESFSIKNLLMINLTFVFAIALIFYLFCLLWLSLIEEKNRKIVPFLVLFPIILVLLLIALVLVGIYM